MDTNIENKITAEELHALADKAINEKTTDFFKDVDKCAKDIIKEMELKLRERAENGFYSLRSSINICDSKYVKEYNMDKFETEVHKVLRQYWLDRGFFVSKLQSNYFEIMW